MNDRFTFPHLEGMYPHQIDVLKNKARFQTLIWHRRARKTSTAIEKLVAECLNPKYPKKVYWHVFPTFNEAKTAIWQDPSMLFRILPEELIERKNETELTVYFKESVGGSILSLKGADNPERLRGAGPFGVVHDEFSEMKEETWTKIIQPIIRANGGWSWFIGTPKGRNHLYRYYIKGQSGGEWSSSLIKSSQSGIIDKEQLENARHDMSEALFNQEFECDFLETEGTVFRSVQRACVAMPEKAKPGHLYVIGIDLAKVQDYTVLAVYDRANNNQVYQDRFNKLDWNFQKSRIIEIAKSYNNALCAVDATGLGSPIVDDLIRAGTAVEPFNIGAQSKKDLIEKLSIWIEQVKIKMIPLPDTIIEFENFSYEIGPTGSIRYEAMTGFHDDIVIAHGLAAYLLFPTYKKDKEIEISPVKAHLLKLKNSSYNTEEYDG